MDWSVEVSFRHAQPIYAMFVIRPWSKTLAMCVVLKIQYIWVRRVCWEISLFIYFGVWFSQLSGISPFREIWHVTLDLKCVSLVMLICPLLQDLWIQNNTSRFPNKCCTEIKTRPRPQRTPVSWWSFPCSCSVSFYYAITRLYNVQYMLLPSIS